MHLFPALSAVALFAEHLAIFGDGFAAEMPRRDVVGFHLGEVEMLAAVGTDAALPLVGRQFLRIGEGSDGKIFLFSGKDVGVDARLLRHVIV